MRGFQRNTAFDKNAVFRAFPGARHNGSRCGKAKRTGAGNHQHRHKNRQCKSNAFASDQPGGSRNNRDNNNGWNKPSGDYIRQPRDGRFGILRLLNHAHNLGERRIPAFLIRPYTDRSIFVHCAAVDKITFLFFHRDALSCEHALIHRCVAIHHCAIHRDMHAGLHDHRIAKLHFFRCHGNLYAVAH